MAEPEMVSFRGGRLKSRKAEEAAWRRQQAAAWLESVAGPLGLPQRPSEQELVAALRNGIALCNAINRVQPGAVAKVVESAACDSQPLTAYQYFENIRNFLDAVEELKLPTFEASDVEKENLDVGSVGKIVDCVLALKAYHERKQGGGTNGPLKYNKSPLAPHSASRVQSRGAPLGSSAFRKHLAMTEIDADRAPPQNECPNTEEAMEQLEKVLLNCILNSKENLDQEILKKWGQTQDRMDPVRLFGTILSSQLEKEKLKPLLELLSSQGTVQKNVSSQQAECSNSDLERRWHLLQAQETELLELKSILQSVRADLKVLQTRFQDDFTKLGDEIQGLSKASLGYNQAVKENRNLYNILQELKGNIRVFCRIRPLLNSESNYSIEHIGNDGSIMVSDPLKPQSARKIFQFNKVFGPTATQDEVYKEAQSLIRSVMDGYNVCIIAYGQTGSGKTHTMCGPSDGLSKDLGINYMALNDLFDISTTREDVKYDIRVQMVEIYNEQVRDLLSEDASSTKLDIRTCVGNGQLSLPDATMHPVQSTDDVMNLMMLGEKHRAVSSTAMNDRSSRSHSILTVHVNARDISGNVSHSSLHLVDLAGSERVDRSEATGDRLKEAQHINKSLSCLGDVITALAQKNSHIPYRNSKLTQLLQSSLGGNGKMLMLAHISPEGNSYQETISSLKFAQRASTVELGAAHVNRESGEIRELKEQIDSLKKALASKELEKSSLKLKENTPMSERMKLPDRTPPRSRRLSLENASSRKTGIPTHRDDRRAPKSPLPMMKASRDYGIIQGNELSMPTKPDETMAPKYPLSMIKACRDYRTVHEKVSARLFEEPLNEENERIITVVDTVGFCQFPPDAGIVSKQFGFDTLQRTPQRSRKTAGEASCPDDPVSGANLDARSGRSSVTKKGSQIKKSIQSSIGKLIHGSERRNAHNSAQETPAKVVISTNYDGPSPIATDARRRRRQSLIGIPPPPSSASRRSSLGGKSDIRKGSGGYQLHFCN